MLKFLLVFGLLDIRLPRVVSSCTRPWASYKGSCYTVISTAADWADASTMCENMGSQLATIDNAAENAFLKRFIDASNVVSGQAWIGGSDVLIKGTWMWRKTQEEVTYSDWCPGQPDNQNPLGEYCMTMTDSCGWEWTDEYCGTKLYSLCEKVYVSQDHAFEKDPTYNTVIG